MTDDTVEIAVASAHTAKSTASVTMRGGQGTCLLPGDLRSGAHGRVALGGEVVLHSGGDPEAEVGHETGDLVPPYVHARPLAAPVGLLRPLTA